MVGQNKGIDEWMYQSAYDYDTAHSLFHSGRYVYTVFMCHLSIEKYLKGLYVKKFNSYPPKTHNLIYFVEKLKLNAGEDIFKFIFILNDASVPTRYPEDLKKLIGFYTQEKTKEILLQTKIVIEWLGNQ